MPDMPTVRYCQTPQGAMVAYAAVGRGAPLVLLPAGFSHVHELWTHPSAATLRARLARAHRFIWYDAIGCGLSDRWDGWVPSLQRDVEQLLAVLDAAGIQRASLLAHSLAAPAAAAFAAMHPERVDRLICCAGFARGSMIARPGWFEALKHVLRLDWVLGSRAMATMLLPCGSAQDVEWYSHYQRAAASALTVERLVDHVHALDARPFLSQVRAPTLLIHNREDSAVPFGAGKELAALIPSARSLVLDGADHDLFIRRPDGLAEAILAFVAGRAVKQPAIPVSAMRLTQREQQVLRLLTDGSSNKEIAESLGICAGTVERHMTNIFGKIGVRGRAQAVTRAIQLGLTRARAHS